MNRIISFAVVLFISYSASAALAQDSTLLEMRNVYSQKCLSVKGASTAHGAPLEHKECGTRNTETIWEFLSAGSGFYQIRNKRSRKCLGVEHQSKSDGALVTQVDGCDQRRDTTWQIETLTLGVPLVIKNRNSQKCLALVTGSEIKQYGCGGSAEHIAKTTWSLAEPMKADSGYKRVFVTEATFQANFLKDASGWDRQGSLDKICQNAANANQLSGTYVVWLSQYDSNRKEGMRVSPLANNVSVPYVNVCDGNYRPIAKNFADLVDSSLDNPISCTEKGRQYQGTPGVWTGTRTDGRPAHYDALRKYDDVHGSPCHVADFCWNYTLAGEAAMRPFGDEECFTDPSLIKLGSGPFFIPSQPLQSLVGNAGAKDKNWTQYRWLSCQRKNAFRLYCFEQ